MIEGAPFTCTERGSVYNETLLSYHSFNKYRNMDYVILVALEFLVIIKSENERQLFVF